MTAGVASFCVNYVRDACERRRLIMHAIRKNFIRSAVIALGLGLLGTGAASAGEWRLNANKCPDLREDY